MASGFVQLEDRWAGGLVGMWGPITRAFSALLMTLNLITGMTHGSHWDSEEGCESI